RGFFDHLSPPYNGVSSSIQGPPSAPMRLLHCINALSLALLVAGQNYGQQAPPPPPPPPPAPAPSYGASAAAPPPAPAAPPPAEQAPVEAAPVAEGPTEAPMPIEPPPAEPAAADATAAATAVAAPAAAPAATGYMGPMMMPVGGYGGPDFDPNLLGGRKGFPGLRARLNMRFWQYASMMLHMILDREIQRARIPDIIQSTQPLLNGCVAFYNAYVSRFRSPCKVAVYPKPPNKIRLQIEGLDICVKGNLAGRISFIIPIDLEHWMPCGVLEVCIWGINIGVDVEVANGPCGPQINVCECAMTVDHVKMKITNGGLVGDIFNSHFARQASKQVKETLPRMLCKTIRKLVMEQVNTRSNLIPRAISLTQMAQIAGGALNRMPPRPDPVFCEQQCGMKMGALASMGVDNAVVAPQIPTAAYGASNATKFARSVGNREYPWEAFRDSRIPPMIQRSHLHPHVHMLSAGHVVRHHREIAIARTDARQQPFRRQDVYNGARPFRREKRQAFVLPNNLVALPISSLGRTGQSASRLILPRGPRGAASKSTAVAAAPPPAPPPQMMNPMCQMCMMSADDPAGLIRDFAMNLNLGKLKDMYLSTQLLMTCSTYNDYTVDLTGEFSPGGQGGTPFGPFPTMFPKPVDHHMVEAIVSDYTINSLLYWMHKKGFLNFRIGPETPKIGELLKTTCSEDEEGLADVPPQTDEETDTGAAATADAGAATETQDTAVEMQPAAPAEPAPVSEYGDKAPPPSDKQQYQDLPKRLRFRRKPRQHGKATLVLEGRRLHRRQPVAFVKLEKRIARQESTATSAAGAAATAAEAADPAASPVSVAGADPAAADATDPLAGGSLADLGICLGDILPAVKEKYPNRKIAIMIHTIRAPSICFSAAKGGSVIVDVQADADLCIEPTMEKVGTITVIVKVEASLQYRMMRLYGMGEITELKLMDMTGSLGLPQDALDNLGTLGKELISKVANDALMKGIPLNIGSGAPGLPLTFKNVDVCIINHGLWVGGDVMVSQDLIGMLSNQFRDIDISI
ncbi:hypothetical protein PMAYCL1PPCAC_17221, partial [Pristionchus mayeri]